MKRPQNTPDAVSKRAQLVVAKRRGNLLPRVEVEQGTHARRSLAAREVEDLAVLPRWLREPRKGRGKAP